MFFNRTYDYFGKFNIYGEMSCYIEKILQICLNKLDLYVVSVIYHQMIKDWEALIFLENSKTTKFCSLDD